VTVRIATAADLDAVAALRRAWRGRERPVDDGGAFEVGFADWYAAERVGARRGWPPPARSRSACSTSSSSAGCLARDVRARLGLHQQSLRAAEHRNGGLGHALLDAAIDAAKQREYARLVLSPSVRAVPLYERVGSPGRTS